MTITPERLAAYADGELSREDARAVEAAIAADPELQAKLAQHRALRNKLMAHFAPIAEQPVPDFLRQAVIRSEAEVIDFAAEVRKRRGDRPAPPRRWARFVGPALAASLVLALVGVNMWSSSGDYAQGPLAVTLDTQLVATQKPGAPVRVLLSFRDGEGRFCRSFAGEVRSGVACRDDRGWRLVKLLGGSESDVSQYRQAGSKDAAVIGAIQDMAVGQGLDAQQEAAAVKAGWTAK